MTREQIKRQLALLNEVIAREEAYNQDWMRKHQTDKLWPKGDQFMDGLYRRREGFLRRLKEDERCTGLNNGGLNI